MEKAYREAIIKLIKATTDVEYLKNVYTFANAAFEYSDEAKKKA